MLGSARYSHWCSEIYGSNVCFEKCPVLTLMLGVSGTHTDVKNIWYSQ